MKTWNGSFDVACNSVARPSDKNFADHFTKLLNSDNNRDSNLIIPSSGVYIPILDNDISPIEVQDQINKLKTSKGPGLDGIPPGVIKLLPDEWLLLITFIFNKVFSGYYPTEWCSNKTVVLHKKGDVSDVNNYRGISIANVLPKLYDSILNARFSQWYTPCREQAGAQPSRGCEEQILTLRLYMDIAKKLHQTLYILFVDYQKAYDRVNRMTLLNMLCASGCGDKFICALGNGLQKNFGIIGNTQFQYRNGVKQGSAVSCNLFTYYLDYTVRAVRTFGDDGFLGENHALLLMDDTILMATSRNAMERKLLLLYNSANDINMIMHPEKCKYMVVNSTDKEPFILENIRIEHTDRYIYLGVPISVSSISNQIKDHIHNKQGHVLKYHAFIHRNYNAPYSVKKTVLDAAVNSALLYSCESWLSRSIQGIDTTVASCVRSLLGVRNQISKDLLYTESGIIPPTINVRMRQIKFFEKIASNIALHDRPVNKAILLAKEVHSPMGVYITELENDTTANVQQQTAAMHRRILGSTKTRMVTYQEFNPELTVHRMYTSSPPEWPRINLTRLRLSSHYLKIETGRWSRIPRERRLCQCEDNQVQTEAHVLLHCKISAHLRVKYNTLDFHSVKDLMHGDVTDLALYCSEVLGLYTNL